MIDGQPAEERGQKKTENWNFQNFQNFQFLELQIGRLIGDWTSPIKTLNF